MVTTQERTNVQTGSGSGYRRCEGCPRCRDSSVATCPTPHPEFNGLHPVCKVCGHCVLRGKHQDSGEDLDNYSGKMGRGFGGPQYSAN